MLGIFLDRRIAAKFLAVTPRETLVSLETISFMCNYRNTDGASLIGDRAVDGLADPPGRVRREFKTAFVFKLFDSFNQSQAAFLNQSPASSKDDFKCFLAIVTT